MMVGSYVILMISACPVTPFLTYLYVGFYTKPPEYPD